MTDPQFIRIESAPARSGAPRARRPVSLLDPLLDRHARALRVALAVITALGALVRFHDLGVQSLWFDEIVESNIARGTLPTIIPELWQWENEMPVDYFVQHLVFRVAGFSEAAARAPAALWSTLTVPVSFGFVRAALGPAAGLTAAALIAVSPFHHHYAQEARPYSLLLLLSMLSTWALWHVAGEASRGRRRSWAALALLLPLMTWTHLSAALVVFFQQAWIWLRWLGARIGGRPEERRLRRVALGSVLIAAGCAASLFLVWGRTSNTHGRAAFLEFAMPRWGHFLSTLTFGHEEDQQVQGSGWFGLAAFSIGLAAVWTRRPAAALLLTLLGPVFLAACLLMCFLSDHWFSARYAYPALVPFLAVAAAGLNAVAGGLARLGTAAPVLVARRPGLALGLLALMIGGGTLAGAAYLHRVQYVKLDWPRMLAEMQETLPPDALIVTQGTLSAMEMNFYAAELGLPLVAHSFWTMDEVLASAEAHSPSFILSPDIVRYMDEAIDIWGLPPMPLSSHRLDLLAFERDPRRWAAWAAPPVAERARFFERGGRRLDVGEEHIQAVGPGWGFPEIFNDEFSFRWMARTTAALLLPLEGPRDLYLAFRASTFAWPGAPPQLAIVRVNGHPVAFGALLPDWFVYGAACSAEVWQAGANLLEFEIDHVASPEATVGSPDGRPLGIGVDWVQLFEGPARPGAVDHDWTGAAIPEAL